MIMDVSGLERSPFTPDITAEEVAKAAGKTIEEVRSFEDARPAAEVMKSGAVRIVKDLHNSGKFQGIISVGGSMGCYITSAPMRELPVGALSLCSVHRKLYKQALEGM